MSSINKLSAAIILGLTAVIIYQMSLLDAAAQKIPPCPEYERYRLGSSIYDGNEKTLQCFYILELDSSWRKKK